MKKPVTLIMVILGLVILGLSYKLYTMEKDASAPKAIQAQREMAKEKIVLAQKKQKEQNLSEVLDLYQDYFDYENKIAYGKIIYASLEEEGTEAFFGILSEKYVYQIDGALDALVSYADAEEKDLQSLFLGSISKDGPFEIKDYGLMRLQLLLSEPKEKRVEVTNP